MAVRLFYWSIKMRQLKLIFVSFIIEKILRYVFGCEIYSRMKIGIGLQLPHNGLGVVINPNSVIGNNVKIHQSVTIGGREGSGCPIIEDNVLIGAGAKVLGDIRVGKGAKIGANAVVLQNVPAYTIAVGVPAVIKNKK